MILSSAIKSFLKEPRDDHRWMKRLKTRDLDDMIMSLEPRPKLHPSLRDSQKVCFLLGVAYPQFSFWLEMGLGKTLITLELLKYWHRCGQMRKALVFLISDKAFYTWETQTKEYGINLPFLSLEGTSVQKWDALERFDEGLVFLTYPGTVAMCCRRGRKKRGKSGLILDNLLVKQLCEGVDAHVMDESTVIGHGSSLTNRLNYSISRRANIRYALAGRPFGRDPTMLWEQQYVVDRGESLGETLGLFRGAFFSQEKNRFSTSKYSFNYKFLKRKTPDLTRMMQHRSISYETDEVLDMPKRMVIIHPVPFSEVSQTHYRRAANELAKTRGSLKECENLFMRMRQITSGFIGFKDDESGEKVKLSFDENPKLDSLIELIDQMRDDRKAIIFYEFTWSAEQIIKEFKRKKLDHIWLWSGTKNSRKALHKFTSDANCRFALVNNKVGAYSLDGLQVANYVFIYESPVSVIDREQLERRAWRPGQKRKVKQYDLAVTNSVDERILEFHREGRDLMSEVRKDPAILS